MPILHGFVLSYFWPSPFCHVPNFSIVAVSRGVRDHRGLFLLGEDFLQALAQRSVSVWGAAAWSRCRFCISRLYTQLYIHGNHGSLRIRFLFIIRSHFVAGDDFISCT